MRCDHDALARLVIGGTCGLGASADAPGNFLGKFLWIFIGKLPDVAPTQYAIQNATTPTRDARMCARICIVDLIIIGLHVSYCAP